MADTVVIYTHPKCTYSEAAKDELKHLGVEYMEIDLDKNPEKWEELESFTGGERITPVILEGDQVTIGFHGVG